MPEISIDLSEVKALGDALEGVLAKDMPFLCAYALTKTMQAVQLAEQSVMGQVFDRPTAYTLNSLAVIPATKSNLTAQLYVREHGGTPAWKFLNPEIEGGSRRKKSFERRMERAGILGSDEFVVPGKGMQLDANGNMPGGIIERILSQIGAAELYAGYDANMTKRSRKGAIRRSGGRYFVAGGGSTDTVPVRRHKLARGIYFRADHGRTIIPVMIFVQRPRYTARYPYYGTARELIPVAFKANFHEGWQRYVLPKLKAR